MGNLYETLKAFTEKVNQNKMVAKMIKDWDRNVQIESVDESEWYTIEIKNKIASVELGKKEPRHVLLTANSDTLSGIFTGLKNPAKEYANGNLRFIGNVKDEMKLDAIVQFIWM